VCAVLQHPAAMDDSVDWRALMLIVRFKLALDPSGDPPRWRKLGFMWHTLSIGLVLAIGTELTIQWNYIKGIQSLASVGQLIPLALGVGGLAKVIWGAFEGDKEWCGKTCKIVARLNKWKEVAKMWLEANELSQKTKG